LAGTPESAFPARSPESLRIPPHSVEAEQSVLGGLMLDNSAWDTIADAVSARISTGAITA
jgi:replicative DNA helicase